MNQFLCIKTLHSEYGVFLKNYLYEYKIEESSDFRTAFVYYNKHRYIGYRGLRFVITNNEIKYKNYNGFRKIEDYFSSDLQLIRKAKLENINAKKR